MRNVTLFVSTVMIIVNMSISSLAGTSSGGGGGDVHDRFIAAGKRVLTYLAKYPEGKALTKVNKLNLCRLNQTLDEKLVFVSKDGLLDQRGSVVDAFTYGWEIILDPNEWENHFEKNRDIYYLVLKEMLRSERTHFNNAIQIARNLLPFPRELFLDKSISENLNFDDSCLTIEDEKQIEIVKQKAILLNARELTKCVPENFPASDLMPADQMLSLAKNTQCKFEPTECGTPDASLVKDNYIEMYRTISWQGKTIYFKLYSKISRKDFSAENILSDFMFANVQKKFDELVEYGICKPKQNLSKISTLGPNEGIVRDLGGDEEAILPYTYLGKSILKPAMGCDQECLNKEYVGIVGRGSRLEILDRQVYRKQSTQSIKVRVLDNTIQNVDSRGNVTFSNGTPTFTPYLPQNARRANVGDEGYVAVSQTTFAYSYDGFIIKPR